MSDECGRFDTWLCGKQHDNLQAHTAPRNSFGAKVDVSNYAVQAGAGLGESAACHRQAQAEVKDHLRIYAKHLKSCVGRTL
eukprot:3836282-Amphidinium_carterae.1